MSTLLEDKELATEITHEKAVAVNHEIEAIRLIEEHIFKTHSVHFWLNLPLDWVS